MICLNNYFYQNRVVETKSEKLDNGKYKVDIEFKVVNTETMKKVEHFMEIEKKTYNISK